MNLASFSAPPNSPANSRTRIREVLNQRTRLSALLRFLLFAVAASLLLTGIKVSLGKLPFTAPMLRQLQGGTMSASLLILFDGIGLLAVLLLSSAAARLERRPLHVFGLPFRAAFQKRFWQGFLWGLALTWIDILTTQLLGGFSFGAIALSPGKIAAYAFAWCLAFTLVGLFEEFLYRGYALHTLSTAFGFWPAAILLAALFGGLHLTNAGESAIGALDVAAYALLASFTLRRTGNLWFAVGLHAAWDFSLTFLYSVPGSGLQAKGQLLHSQLHGARWLTGGSAGPEGSVIGLAVLLLSFFMLAKLFPQRKANDVGSLAS